MDAYIGTKIIQAEPMSEWDFIEDIKNNNEPLPFDNRDGYCVTYPDGYMSWSPKAVFEGAYRKVTSDESNIIADGMF